MYLFFYHCIKCSDSRNLPKTWLDGASNQSVPLSCRRMLTGYSFKNAEKKLSGVHDSSFCSIGKQLINGCGQNGLSSLFGSTLNHWLHHANIKPFIAEKNSDNPRVFLVAFQDIAQTTQLLWNYNDDQCHFYSNSKTLPEAHLQNFERWPIKTANDSLHEINIP